MRRWDRIVLGVSAVFAIPAFVLLVSVQGLRMVNKAEVELKVATYEREAKQAKAKAANAI